MIVEGLGSITFVNGILRVQLTAIDPDGKIRETGTIEIPGTKVADVIQGLAGAAQGISNKLNEGTDQKDSKDSKKKDNKKGKSVSKKAN